MAVMAKFEFVDDLGNDLMAIATDRTWYANNYDDICVWLELQGNDTGHIMYSAGIIFLRDAHVKDLFILRWA
jgi:hypothetical protein